jgi:type IV pilus assembly protein PilX
MISSRPMKLARLPHRQQGVVLFIALIAMVILSLGGVALVRSMEAGTSVAGNLAFRQVSIVAVNRAIEDSVWKIYKAPAATLIVTTADDLPNHYYASLQAGEKSDGTPVALAGAYPPAAYPGAMNVWTDPASLVEVRYVIERVCTVFGAVTIGNCDLLPPKVSPGGTDNEVKRIPIPPIPHFRVTVRVDLPNTNSTTVAQAFLR